MDYRLEQLVNGPAGNHAVLDRVMVWVASDLVYLFFAAVVLWFLYGWWRGLHEDRRGAIAAGMALILALIVNAVVAAIWVRPRPFVAHPATVHLILLHGRDASFPSDHAAMTFAVATVLVLLHRRLGLLAFLAAAAVCYARVYVGDHYPGDVLGGAAVGAACGLVLGLWASGLPDLVRKALDDLIRALHLPLEEEAG
ncbi:MAG: phosphatase PAP2 family protein [Candidatus Dormibacterales bacterium]